MANLELIKKLNEEYGKQSPIRPETKSFAINEAIDPERIEKALPNSLASMGPTYTMYFDVGLPADVALIFVDICNFSTRQIHLNGEEIAMFFDSYYDVIIPIIYKYGGEIDKIIGDGIIAVFGPPFMKNDINISIQSAQAAAKEIIKSTKGSEMSSKIALHSGTINYFKSKTSYYKEFTMIGKPLTELFRLESISLDEQISYYSESGIREFYEPKLASSAKQSNTSSEWMHATHPLPQLKGVSYSHYHTIRHNK